MAPHIPARLTGRLGAIVAGLAVAALCDGCPVPVPREFVRWPDAAFVVAAEDGTPIEGAALTVYHWSFPYRRLERTLEAQSGADGVARIRRMTDDEVVFPLLMHGVREYHWSYAIEKDGHVTAAGSIYGPAPAKKLTIRVTLKKGVRVPVRGFESISLLDLSLPRSPDGLLGGPVDYPPPRAAPAPAATGTAR